MTWTRTTPLLLRRAIAALLVVGTLCFAVPPARAADTIAGPYHGTVVLGPVLLDGRYPFTVGTNSPGMIDVTTSPTGALTARISAAAMTMDVVGRLVSGATAVRVTLGGKVSKSRISIVATLRGNAFVGTIKLLGKTSPCRIEVGSVGPIRAQYQLALTSSPKGAITGTGTLGVGSQKVNVLARGSMKKGRVTLSIQGGATVLKVTGGSLAAGSVTSRTWTAKGFGASFKGRRRLTIVPG